MANNEIFTHEQLAEIDTHFQPDEELGPLGDYMRSKQSYDQLQPFLRESMREQLLELVRTKQGSHLQLDRYSILGCLAELIEAYTSAKNSPETATDPILTFAEAERFIIMYQAMSPHVELDVIFRYGYDLAYYLEHKFDFDSLPAVDKRQCRRLLMSITDPKISIHDVYLGLLPYCRYARVHHMWRLIQKVAIY